METPSQDQPVSSVRNLARKVIGILPKKTQRKLFGYYWTMKSPDRIFLVQKILPVFSKLGGTILWVGTEKYTRNYPTILEQNGGTCWTLEIQASLARYGSPGRNVVGDVTKADIYFEPEKFDSVLCNGVFGFGVNTPEEQRAALKAMATIMKSGAYLLLSWENYKKTGDPVASGLTAEWFESVVPNGLEQHYVLGDHEYELLRKK